MIKQFPLVGAFVLVLPALFLVGCNTANGGLMGSKSEESIDPEIAKRNAEYQEQLAQNAAADSNVVKKSAKKSGTYIKALVNGRPITNYDVQRRLAFMKLRRVSGANTKKATEEMVEQEIKMQEARKLGTVASDAEVNAAFANFAKSNRSTPTKISSDLNRMGVGARHFKEYIRSQMSWNRTLGGKFRKDTTQLSQRDAILQLRKSGEDKPQTTEYVIQQVIFVVPASKRQSIMPARRKEANSMRQRFSNCEDTIQLAKQLRDVSVFDRGRVMEPELPGNWKEDIISTPVGGTTKIQDTAKGVEFIAVCSKRAVDDDRAAQIVKQDQKFEEFGDKGNELSDKYLAEAKEKAKVIYR